MIEPKHEQCVTVADIGAMYGVTRVVMQGRISKRHDFPKPCGYSVDLSSNNHHVHVYKKHVIEKYWEENPIGTQGVFTARIRREAVKREAEHPTRVWAEVATEPVTFNQRAVGFLTSQFARNLCSDS